MATKLWAISLMVLLTFLTSAAQIFWKFGAEKLSFDFIALITNWQIFVGILLYVVAGTMMIISFRGGDVSVLYPIVATSYIWVSLLSIYFLDEIMNLFKWLGVLVIFIGIVFIGFGSRESSVIKNAGAT